MAVKVGKTLKWSSLKFDNYGAAVVPAGTIVYKKCAGSKQDADYSIVTGILTGDGKAFKDEDKKCRGPGLFVIDIDDYIADYCAPYYGYPKRAKLRRHPSEVYSKGYGFAKTAKYKLHRITKPDRYDKSNVQCSHGIHFFLDRKSAHNYM